jgi:hypothetical protein
MTYHQKLALAIERTNEIHKHAKLDRAKAEALLAEEGNQSHPVFITLTGAYRLATTKTKHAKTKPAKIKRPRQRSR